MKLLAKNNFTVFANNMKVNSILPNSYYQPKFKGYTPKEICADLCKGGCCNHGTVMNANIKRLADKLYASYKAASESLKSTVLIKAAIVKWVFSSQNPDTDALNDLANVYLEAISKETDKTKLEQLAKHLDVINKKLAELTGDSEIYVPVTNPELVNLSFFDVAANETNICMFKDHGKTNLCTIYYGIKDEAGKTIERPSPCFKFGSAALPCPWLNPEKYKDVFYKTKELLENIGYRNLPLQVIQAYIAKQYNLNEVFQEKIWKPFLEKTKA